MADLKTLCLSVDEGETLLANACRDAGFPIAGASQCIDAGNQLTAPLDAKIADIAKNWHPTDNFDSGQIRGIVRAVMSVVTEAQKAITQASSHPNSNQDLLQNETLELARHGDQAIDYTTAANTADDQTNGIVSAPNIKQWVINAMNAASSAIVTAYTVGCIAPWWIGALAAFQTAFDIAWGTVMSIVGVAVDVGQAVITAAEGAATAVNWSAKIFTAIVKWWPLLGIVLLGGAGFWVYRRFGGKLPKLLPSKDSHAR